MKKIFQLQVENKKPERQLESVKNEIRKYMKRERKKKLPDEATYWDFECKIGENEAEAKSVSVSELIAGLDDAHEKKQTSCYVEIVAKAVARSAKVEEPLEVEPSL